MAGDLKPPLARWTRAAALAVLAAAPVVAGAADAVRAPEAATVRFAPESDYGPFVYAEPDGRIAGLSIDMLQLVAQRAGLRLQWLPARPLAEQLALARRGQVDLLSSLRPTAERAAYLDFSAPYVRVPTLLLVRAGAAGAQPPEGLGALSGQPVAVGAGYAVEPFVRRAYPAVAWMPVPDDTAALRGLREGRFAAAVVDAASAAFVVQRDAIAGLASAGEIGFAYELSFAVRKGNTALLEAIDAALRAIPAAQKREILARWIRGGPSPLAGASDWTRPTLAGLALVAVGVVSGLWMILRRARRREARA